MAVGCVNSSEGGSLCLDALPKPTAGGSMTSLLPVAAAAGVGETGPISRKAICQQLEFLGIKIDDEKNKIRGEEAELSAHDSKVKIYRIPTNEELVIARDCVRLCK